MADYDPNHVPKKSFFLLGVKLILVNEYGEILLLRRSGKVSRPHGWDLPGGGVDAHETIEAAAIREVFEETGIDINTPQLLGSELIQICSDQTLIIGASAAISGSTVSLSWEHEAYEWVALTELHAYSLPRLHTALFARYKNNINSIRS